MKRLSIILFYILIVVGLTGCAGDSSTKAISTDDVIKAFKDAGLAADEPRKMTKDDFGIAPMKPKEAVRFIIPSLGDDSGGRILIYDKEKDLKEMKNYYDELGKSSAILFSWTIAHGNVLVQLNGDLPEEDYNKYKAALEAL
ncbi:stress protein [Paenibacillus mendelii]|uniref:Stress protein n=1 Tax=Paenibacillus mendelii TaxID=206163 RepID=A0ABV6JHE6_9BACL|nr:stress protein [Paenibacillus mendelii]MCQ6558220.1 stress protein [Paenibacillus mendelii]